jgi:hypothetical protein
VTDQETREVTRYGRLVTIFGAVNDEDVFAGEPKCKPELARRRVTVTRGSTTSPAFRGSSSSAETLEVSVAMAEFRPLSAAAFAKREIAVQRASACVEPSAHV